MCKGRKKIALTCSASAQLFGQYGPARRYWGECHIKRGYLGLYHDKHLQEGGRGGKALCCAVGIMATPQQGYLQGKGGTGGHHSSQHGGLCNMVV